MYIRKLKCKKDSLVFTKGKIYYPQLLDYTERKVLLLDNSGKLRRMSFDFFEVPERKIIIATHLINHLNKMENKINKILINNEPRRD